jgi:hypothetical protein
MESWQRRRSNSRSMSRSRSRSLSPEQTRRFESQITYCGTCKEHKNIIANQARALHQFSCLIDKYTLQIQDLQVQLKQFIDQRDIYENIIYVNILSILQCLDSKKGFIIMLPWMDTLYINLHFLSNVYKHVYDQRVYIKKLKKIFKKILHGTIINPTKKSKIKEIFFSYESVTIVGISIYEFLYICKQNAKTLMQNANNVSNKLETFAYKTALYTVGTPLTTKQLQSMYQKSAFTKVFGIFDTKNAVQPNIHFRWNKIKIEQYI